MNPAAPAVAARGLGKRFTDKESGRSIAALADISLQVLPGALTALVGPDGAGKTTLLRIAAGLMRALPLMEVTMPSGMSSSLSTGPCSMCTSMKPR